MTVVDPSFQKPSEAIPPVAPPKAETSEKASSSGETVTVDKAMLERLINKVEKLEELGADLTSAADLGRLQRVQDARNKGKLMKTASVAMYDKKYVVGWASIKDDVWIDADNKLHEDQQIELYLYEGAGNPPSKTKPMSQKEFVRLTDSVKAEVVRETRDDDGQTFQTVVLANGEKLEISIVFLNK